MGLDTSNLMGFLLPGTDLISGLLGGKKKAPQAPTITPPQMAKTPDASKALSDAMGVGQAGGAPGIAQTMLTGAGGIDPNLLKLGKSTLLGGGGG